MDFRGRSSSQTAPVAAQTPAPAQPVNHTNGNQFSNVAKKPVRGILEIASVILLFSVTALVIALTFLLVFGGTSQIKSVQKNKYQAVFLNNGQVYFGNIHSISSKNFDLRNIYYLQTSGGASATATTQSTSATNVSLVKLGCELHAPYDQMLINGDQVIFWENLQDSGQVVKAINDYKKQNATQTCSAQSQSSTEQAPSTSTPTTTTTPATTTTPTTVKKP